MTIDTNCKTFLHTQEEFDQKLGAEYESYGLHFSKVLRNRLGPYRDIKGRFSCRKLITNTLLGLLPFIGIMRPYKPKRDFFKDVVGGITVFVMGIPQAMAYGMLSGIGPIHGLYTSTFPTFLYFFLGTSRHLAIGVAAPPTIISAGALSKVLANIPDEVHKIYLNGSTTGEPIGYKLNGRNLTLQELKVAIATSITLLIGIIQLLMGICHLGFLTIFFSNAMVKAYTTGCGVHVFSSQINYVLGYKVKGYNGVLKLYYFYRDLCLNITKFEWPAFLISTISIGLLVFTKEWLQPRLDKVRWYPRIPFPMEIFLVIFGTIISYFAALKTKGVLIVGLIPPGLPTPIIPSIFFWRSVFVEALLLAILSYSMSISLAKMIASKKSYSIKPNQEMLALGVCNTASSFFQCFVNCGSVARSMVQSNAGGKTQIVSLINVTGMVLLLLFIAPLFEQVPICILAAIIIVALKNIFWQLEDLPRLWRTSIPDFIVWVFTCVATIILDVDLGLIAGFGASLLSIVVRAICSHTATLGVMPTSGEILETSVYPMAQEIPGVKVFRFEGALLFASFDYFRSKLIEKTGVDPVILRKQQKREIKRAAENLEKILSSNQKTNSEPVLAEDAARNCPLPPIPSRKSQDSSKKSQPKDGVDGMSPENPFPPAHTHSVNSTVAEITLSDQRSNDALDPEHSISNKSAGSETSLEVDVSNSLPLHTENCTFAVKHNTPMKTNRNALGGLRNLENLMINKENSINRRSIDDTGNKLPKRTQYIILDASVWAFIDDTAVTNLIEIIKEYRSVGVTIWIAACQTTVRKMLLRSDFANRANENGKLIFFSIQGAIENVKIC